MKLLSATILLGSLASTTAFGLLNNNANVASNSQLNMARKPFISGNWKLNPQTKDEAVTLAADIASKITDKSPEADVALFVPYVFIESAMGATKDKLMVGAEVRRTS